MSTRRCSSYCGRATASMHSTIDFRDPSTGMAGLIICTNADTLDYLMRSWNQFLPKDLLAVIGAQLTRSYPAVGPQRCFDKLIAVDGWLGHLDNVACTSDFFPAMH